MSFETNSGLFVNYIWSKAGYATCIQIKGRNKECDILFDCGNLDDQILSARHVFITHGHIDHIGACISHARAKSLNSTTVTYYVPMSCLEGLIQVKQSFEILEGKEIPMKIVGIAPNEPVEILKRSYKVFAFPTSHRVPSQGYGIIHCHRGEILPTYASSTPQELSKFHKQGIQTHSIQENIEVVYTGDTVFSALLNPELSFIFSADILLLEMTYLDGDRNKASKHCHIHLDDFIEHAHLFQNQQIILMHLSSRYGTAYRILNILQNKLPHEILTRCAVALKCFGFNQSITPLRGNDNQSSRLQMKRTSSVAREQRQNENENLPLVEDIEVALLSERCYPCETHEDEPSSHSTTEPRGGGGGGGGEGRSQKKKLKNLVS